MLITSTPVVRVVEEYDFLFSSGLMMPVSIDRESGDTIHIGPETITIVITSKPSPHDPSVMVPGENLTLFVSHLISIQQRTREVVGMTPDEQEEWKQTIQKLGGTVQ